MGALGSVIGGKSAKALGALGITTVEELLTHYPRRYVERGELTDLGALRVGEQVTVMARVDSARARPLPSRPGQRGRRSILEVVVTDGTGRLTLTFFNQDWLERRFRPGQLGLFAGTVGEFNRTRQLLHPDFELIDSEHADQAAADYAGRLIPVYPATEKVPSWTIAKIVQTALPLADTCPDPLDAGLRERAGVIDRATALRWIHRPEDRGQVRRAVDRLRWDEAFGVQVVLAQRRAAVTASPAVPRPGRRGGLRDAFDAMLPFRLTEGQRAVGQVLESELAGGHPMHRLLQGEVGSGKTVVALRAMLQVVDSGGQAALLAPTEVLAAQHARTIGAQLGPLAQGGMLGGRPDATRVVLVTGSLGASARRAALLEIASGAAGIVVGTHALLEERVQFADLGMVVVDEQHRFGVEQRAALVAKTGESARPHALVMTATPIPRTVAMTVFGDLEVSTLRELPAGRRPLVTHVVPHLERPGFLARTWQRAREEVAAGRQVYVVCPRIDAGTAEADGQPLLADATEAGEPGRLRAGTGGPAGRGDGASFGAGAAVEAVLPELAAGPLAGLRLGALTGRLTAAEKDDVMARFADPARPDGIDVLVATTVIEVGVDIPNATLMIVLDADRFGVSQLHQLRGRVGRGAHAGLCLLVTEAPQGSPARDRLAAVAATTDGFELSRYDLAARREGDVLGAAQSGTRRSLRLLSVLEHEDVIARARAEATALVAEDWDLAAHPVLADSLARDFDPEHAEYLEKA
ncbi:MAG: ATP-dependent DNA helicase RecG [Candidatus Nanopelagicales bacterium]